MAADEKKSSEKQTTELENGDVKIGRNSPLRFLQRAFADASLEKLYLSYSVKQKREGLHCFLLASILYDIYYLAVPCDIVNDFNWPISGFLLSNIIILIWCLVGVQKCSLIWPAIPHISWLISIAQILVGLFLKRSGVTGRDNLGWVVLMDYLLYVLLPLRLRYCVMLSVGTCASYLIAVAGLAEDKTHLVEQVSIKKKNFIFRGYKNGESFFLNFLSRGIIYKKRPPPFLTNGIL